MIVLIDNYDSFTYNIFQYLSQLGARVRVIRNDGITTKGLAQLKPQAIVISPGPGAPDAAGITLDVIKNLSDKYPILGICLGHQAIGAAFGGKIIQAKKPMHGKTSLITHKSQGVFKKIPSPLLVTRYHSLIIDKKTLPSCLRVTATSEDGTIMGVRHKRYLVEGVQFHPESYATQYGLEMLRNFLHEVEIRQKSR